MQVGKFMQTNSDKNERAEGCREGEKKGEKGVDKGGDGLIE